MTSGLYSHATKNSEGAEHPPVRFCYERLHYNCENDSEFEHEVLTVFLRTAAMSLVTMMEAISSGDTSALQEAAHGVKGSALTLGAENFGRLCLALEQMAKEGNTEETQAVLTRAEGEFRELDAELRGYMLKIAA